MYLFICSLLFISACTDVLDSSELSTPYEDSGGRETASYEEGLAWWQKLETASPFVCVQKVGETDAGLPLHLVIINAGKNFSREKIAASGKTIWLINNGIHPGEPDGIDASMLFARDILSATDFKQRFANTVLLIIPFYNVGGALDRNCCSRSNQNGPESYGFRGNARNLDLNRDFAKCDSKNAQSFNQLYASWDPDIYLETHVSNGADYPYTMTYLSTQADKLGASLGNYIRTTLNPALFKAMAAKGDEMIPYVNVHGQSPDSGYAAFNDSPRYSTGYAALHHSVGLLTETHMLKPFDERVASTHRFLHCLADEIIAKGDDIKKLRAQAAEEALHQRQFPIEWEIDSAKASKLLFKGYRAYFDSSKVTGLPQLYYDRSQTWENEIAYYEAFKPTLIINAPAYYLVPSAWSEVVDRLKWNGVEMKLIEKDTLMKLSAYEIIDYESSKQPFEGHYVHYATKTEEQFWVKKLRANSYFLINTAQLKKRFIVEMLEPSAPDSYFNWNFYDEILQQKEWFSAYVFDKEAEILLEDEGLKTSFEAMKANDPSFTMSPMPQLYYLYKNSDHYEREHHMIYPVYRIE